MRSLTYSFTPVLVAMAAAIAFAALSVVVTPQMAHADQEDLEDLLEQIEELQELVEQLQRQLAAQQEGGTVSPDIEDGARVQTTAVLNVRDDGTVTGDLLGTQAAFAGGVVTDGPETADGYQWFLVDYDQGPDGWSAAGWLRLAEDSEPDDGGDEIGTLTIENLDGGVSGTIADITRDRALDACLEWIDENGDEDDRYECTFDDEVVFATSDDPDEEEDAPRPTCDISASPDHVPATGGSVTFTWDADNNNGASLWGAGQDANPFDGGDGEHTMFVKPKIQVLEIWGPGGTDTCVTGVSSDGDDSVVGILTIENLDGGVSGTIADITRDRALDACLEWIDENGDEDDRYRCTFDDDVIHETGDGDGDEDNETDRETARYEAFANGTLFASTDDITYAEALESCMTNAAGHPTDYIRCTWDGEEIYDRVVSNDPSVGTYEGFADGDRFIRTDGITRADALAHCRAVARQHEGDSIRCTWEGNEIYVDNVNDGLQPAPSCSISATPSSVPSAGDEVTFTWTASNNNGASLWGADDANPFDGGNGSHTMTVRPKTQILEVWGSGGSALCLTVVKAR